MSLVALKRDAKFEEKLISCFKNDKKVSLSGSFSAKYIMLELKKYEGVIFHATEE